MGERKVLNKHYPPDFDPAKISRRKQPKNQQMKEVRMMLPMSIRCNTCGTYIYKGAKFNSRKEDVIDETYLGIQIFRFYFKCTKCSAELTIKTDPQNSDYVVESGAARNFEPWRAESLKAMKSSEKRASDSKQDMDILAALEEMKSIKSRHAAVRVDDMLEALKRSACEKEKKIMDGIDKADEEVIKSVTFPGSKDFVRRIQDDEDEDLDDDWHQSSSTLRRSSKSGEALGGSLVPKPKFITKPRPAAKDPESEEKAKKDGESQSKASSGNEMASGLLSLFQDYDSDESDYEHPLRTFARQNASISSRG